LVLLFFYQSLAYCNVGQYAYDPEPWGGATCLTNADCNGNDYNGYNKCILNKTCQTLQNIDCAVSNLCDRVCTGVCVCDYSRGNTNCSHQRIFVLQPGVLNMVPFSGVGNLLIGRIGAGIPQLLMCLIGWGMICGSCLCLCSSTCLGDISKTIYVVIMIVILLSAGIWAIVDGAFILQCVYRDPQGYAMYFFYA
jgi:hypothetical protein